MSATRSLRRRSYNRDNGKSVPIFGVKVLDNEVRRLHKVGLAKEVDMPGTVTFQLDWTRGERFNIRELLSNRW
jgi:hypothetical protein